MAVAFYDELDLDIYPVSKPQAQALVDLGLDKKARRHELCGMVRTRSCPNGCTVHRETFMCGQRFCPTCSKTNAVEMVERWRETISGTDYSHCMLLEYRIWQPERQIPKIRNIWEGSAVFIHVAGWESNWAVVRVMVLSMNYELAPMGRKVRHGNITQVTDFFKKLVEPLANPDPEDRARQEALMEGHRTFKASGIKLLPLPCGYRELDVTHNSPDRSNKCPTCGQKCTKVSRWMAVSQHHPQRMSPYPVSGIQPCPPVLSSCGPRIGILGELLRLP